MNERFVIKKSDYKYANKLIKLILLIAFCLLTIFLLICYQPTANKFYFKDTIGYFNLNSVEKRILVATRTYNVLIPFFSGVAICVAGSIFQSVFKNPLASPRTIGSSAGVTLGNMAFVLLYGSSAPYFLTNRYFLCYGLSILMILLTGVLARALGGKKSAFPIESFLITGILVSSFVDIFVIYCQNLLINDDTGLIYIYMQYANGDLIFLDRASLTAFFSALLIGSLFLLFIRRKIDVLTFDDNEAASMGINVGLQRVLSIITGCILSTVAVVHCGSIGFIAMAIPYFFRATSNKGFYDVCFKSAITGGLFMAIARTFFSVLLVHDIAVPSSAVVTLLSVPIFMILIIKNNIFSHNRG